MYNLWRDKEIAETAYKAIKEYYEAVSLLHIPSGPINARTKASLIYEKLKGLAEIAAMASISVKNSDDTYLLASFYYWLIGLAKFVEEIAKKEVITDEEVKIIDKIEGDIKLLESLANITPEDVLSFLHDFDKSLPKDVHEAINVAVAARLLDSYLEDIGEV